ncbi:MAG TPA: hypothetical protein VKS60_16985, partial [Stellaceae bacterium]|nr:hypothetical protein [Stellaceae bacterium]
MAYVDRVLQPGETVLCRSRLHWLVFSRSILTLILAALCLGGTFYVADGEIQAALLIAAVVLGVIGIIAWLGAAIRRGSTELAVTDHRVIYKTGVIARHTAEMNRSKVE